MNREYMAKEVYRMAGLLEGMTCMQGQTVTESMVYILADCVDRMELMGAALLEKDVTGDGSGKDAEATEA